MILDTIYKLKMSPKMMRDFMGFGFTVKYNLKKVSILRERDFDGCIHRFAVFCDKNTGDVTYETIDFQNFKNNPNGFKSFYSKLSRESQYKEYPVLSNGNPDLNVEKIREVRFGL